jgi:protein-tyrosine-phosphatase
MVCTANQCRSPMAEVLLRDVLRRRGLDSVIQVASAGVWAEDGLPATEFAVQAALERGLDLRSHGSRRATPEVLKASSVILAMTEAHRRSLQALVPHLAPRIFLLTEMAGEDWSIPDPVGGPLEGYRALAGGMMDLLERGVPRIVELTGIEPPGEASAPAEGVTPDPGRPATPSAGSGGRNGVSSAEPANRDRSGQR